MKLYLRLLFFILVIFANLGMIFMIKGDAIWIVFAQLCYYAFSYYIFLPLKEEKSK